MKILSAAFAALLAFYLGTRAAAFAIVYWIWPLNKQDPDYGQLDIPGFLVAAYVGGGIALVVFVVGIAWTVKTSLPKRNPNRMNTLPSR